MCELNHAEIEVTIDHDMGEKLLDVINALGTASALIGAEADDLKPLVDLYNELALAMNLSHSLAATTGAEGFM